MEECGDFNPYLDQLSKVLSNPEIQVGLMRSSRYLLIDEIAIFTNPNIISLLKQYSYNGLIHPTGYQTARIIISKAIALGLDAYVKYIIPRVTLTEDERTVSYLSLKIN